MDKYARFVGGYIAAAAPGKIRGKIAGGGGVGASGLGSRIYDNMV